MSQVVTHDTPAESNVVQFYENDARLADILCGLIAGSFEKGRRVIVLATLSCRQSIEKALAARGIHVPAARMRYQYVDLDAAYILSRILVNSQPDRPRFNAVMRDLTADVPPECRGACVFDETMALLWAQGMREAALQLETMWRELARTHGFSLYCAYPRREFSVSAAERDLQRVCARQPHFLPSLESRDLTSSMHRLRDIDQFRLQATLRREQERKACDPGEGGGRYWLGLDGRILWANRAELNLLGYEPEEYIGRHISESYAEPEVVDDILQRLRSNKAVYDYPARRLCKNGSVKSTRMYSTGMWKWRKVTYICCLTRSESEPSFS